MPCLINEYSLIHSLVASWQINEHNDSNGVGDEKKKEEETIQKTVKCIAT